MKPVAIFRHVTREDSGYFSAFLERHEIDNVLIKVDQNQAIPTDPTAYSGLVFMGGDMSVNDPLPWITPSLALIRKAYAADIPLLGHCLGGQLISKALGATVSPAPVKEIGWGEVYVSDNDSARAWLDGLTQFTSFHWHGETFTLPDGATHIIKSDYCDNQAYVIGKHLAMQCHVEMTANLIEAWTAHGAEEITQAAHSPAVQSVSEIKTDMEARLTNLNRVADRLYSRWIKGLKSS